MEKRKPEGVTKGGGSGWRQRSKQGFSQWKVIAIFCILLIAVSIAIPGVGGVSNELNLNSGSGEEVHSFDNQSDQLLYSSSSISDYRRTSYTDFEQQENIDSQNSTEIHIEQSLLESDEPQTALVTFDSPSAATLDSATPVESMQTHADMTQDEFVRFSESTAGLDVERQFWIVNAVVVTFDPEKVDVNELSNVGHVETIKKNTQHEPQSVKTTTDPGTDSLAGNDTVSAAPTSIYRNYELEIIGAYDVWEEFNTTGEGVSVAVLDTGVYGGHSDIEVDEWQEWNLYGFPIDSVPYDQNGHGTKSSGLVNGGDPSGVPIGVAPGAKHYHGKISTQNDGSTYDSQIIAGVEWAVANDVDIISISYGSEGYDSTYIDLFRNANAAGSTIFTSSGNDGPGTSGKIGNEYEAFSIGASGPADQIASFSSGEKINTREAWGTSAPSDWPDEMVVPDVVAPGMHTWSTTKDGGRDWYSGTSAAAPTAAGAGALLISITDGELSPSEIRDLFQQTADDVGANETRQGAGRINVYEAALEYSRANFDPQVTPGEVNVLEGETLVVETDLPVTEYTWEFEDGTTQTTHKPEITKAFDELGTTEVVLTVEDTGGETLTTTIDIKVVDEVSPIADLEVNGSKMVEVGTETVELDGSQSSDNHKISHYNWTLPSGETIETQSPTVNHVFTDLGNKTIEITVIDEAGNENTTDTIVHVVDTTPPTVDFETPDELFINTPATFSGNGSTDNYAIENYEWDFGDGSNKTTTESTTQYTFTDSGEYTVTLSARDQSQNTNYTSKTVTVEETPSVLITDPKSDTYLTDRNVSINYRLSHVNVDAATGLEYRVTDDNGQVVTDWTAGPYNDTKDEETFTVSTGDLPDGNYTIEMRLLASDGSVLGFESANDALEFSIKASSPSVEIDAEPMNGEFELISQFNPAIINVTADDPLESIVEMTITDSDQNPVSTWNLTTDTGDGELVTNVWNATNTNNESVATGEYTVFVSVTDEVGNTNISSTTINVDADAPTVNVSSISGGNEIDGAIHVNGSQTLMISVDADDVPTELGAVENLEVTVQADAQNYRKTLDLVRSSETSWTGSLNTSDLPNEGQYLVRATVVDSARNTNSTVYSSTIAADRTAPQMSSVLTDIGENGATLSIRSSEPLENDPAVNIVDPENNETSLDGLTVESETSWVGTVRLDGAGYYSIAAVGEDRAGNLGETSTNMSIAHPIAKNNTTKLHYNNRTGTFIEFNTSTKIDNSTTLISETETAPYSLEPGIYPAHFLTSHLDDELDANLKSATIGLSVEDIELPGDIKPTDDGVTLQRYNESESTWESQPVEVREVEYENSNQMIEGTYWITTVESLGTYGLTVNDTNPPMLISTSPGAGESLSADTDTVELAFKYEDELAGIDPASVMLSVDGTDVTSDENTTITADAATHILAVNSGESYNASATISDRVNNTKTYEMSFEIDKNNGNGGGGFALPTPSSTNDADEPAEFVLGDLEVPGEATVGETIEATVPISNIGEENDTAEVTLSFADTTKSDQITLSGGESDLIVFSIQIPDEEDEIELEFETRDDTDTATVVIVRNDNSEETTETDRTDDAADSTEVENDSDRSQSTSDSDDGLPGFGVLSAAIVLIGCSVLLARKSSSVR